MRASVLVVKKFNAAVMPLAFQPEVDGPVELELELELELEPELELELIRYSGQKDNSQILILL